jgi:hypothetical protein
MADTETLETTAAPAATAEPDVKPADKETPDELNARARKPPTDGTCKRCGLPKPVNRLKLCYPCWVKSENEGKGWKEGQPHPSGCGCDLDCRFDSTGAAKGANN